MKKKVRLFAAMILALSMMLGNSVCAFAYSDGDYINEIILNITTPYDGMTADELIGSISFVTENMTRNGGGPGAPDGYFRGYRYVVDNEGQDIGINGTLVAGQSYKIFFQAGTQSGKALKCDEYVYTGNITVNGITGSARGIDANDTTDATSMTIEISFSLAPDPSPSPEPGPSPEPDDEGHTHNWEYRTFSSPSIDHDGEEGEVCTICGERRNVSSISAFEYALYGYAYPLINNAKSGQTITFEFGEWNSFPQAFMEKIAAKTSQNVTFVFKFKYQHQPITITIPAGSKVNTEFKWFGPAKMLELYGNR